MNVACVVLVICMFVCTYAEARIDCYDTADILKPCFIYLLTDFDFPEIEPDCCNAVKKVDADAITKRDRRETCSCLKQLASNIFHLDVDKGDRLFDSCGAKIHYKINPNAECAKYV